MDDIITENVKLNRKIANLTALVTNFKIFLFQKKKLKKIKKFSEGKKSKLEKEAKKEKKKDEEEKKVMPTTIISTYNYSEINEDGSKNMYTLRELDLNNFQILFKYFLDSVTFPSLEHFETVINWKLKQLHPSHVALITGPGDSSRPGLFF